MYGSDAIGGVINFIKEKPAPVGTVTGDYNLQLFSNSLGMTNNLGIKGSVKELLCRYPVWEQNQCGLFTGWW